MCLHICIWMFLNSIASTVVNLNELYKLFVSFQTKLMKLFCLISDEVNQTAESSVSSQSQIKVGSRQGASGATGVP